MVCADERSVFVAETGQYRIWKFPASARNLNAGTINPAGENRPGEARVVLANLPGYPDNLMRAMHGRIRAGLVKPRSKTNDDLAGKPFLRKLALCLPKSL